jgi:CDP-glucose 4,6-dehydratase
MEKIAIFGNTGFVGTWLSEYLLNSTKKIDLFGYSLKPNTKPSIFRSLKQEKRINYQQYGNVLNEKKILDFIKDTKPNKIIYLASQPIVKIGLKNPRENFLINNIGLINFFESLRKSNIKYLKKVIIFTSDKVYENLDNNKKFIETDNLGGSDPYSASKACQEIISTSYFNSFFKNKFEMITLRAGNIIGGGDWAENRIIPDLIRSLFHKEKLHIRNPESVRPWQNILDVCGAIDIILKNKINKKVIVSYNIGTLNNKKYKVNSLEKYFNSFFNIKSNRTDKTKNTTFSEKNFLSINSKKIFQDLNFKNILTFESSNKLTCEWYKDYYNKKNMVETTNKQISFYKSKLEN